MLQCVCGKRGDGRLVVYLLLGLVLLRQQVDVLLEINHLRVDIAKKRVWFKTCSWWNSIDSVIESVGVNQGCQESEGARMAGPSPKGFGLNPNDHSPPIGVP